MARPSVSDRDMIADLSETERSGAIDIVALGIDLGKNVCSLVGLDGERRVALRRCISRERVAGFARHSQIFCLTLSRTKVRVEMMAAFYSTLFAVAPFRPSRRSMKV